jgi:ribosomal protein L7Ae-like RNA K-turn-binding protein
LAESKTAAYLGFARRAGKLTLGVNAVSMLRGGVYLLIADSSASENTKKEIEKLTRKLSAPLVWTERLDLLTGKEFCKLAALRERNLAEAILAERRD